MTILLEQGHLESAISSCERAEHWATRVHASYARTARNVNQAIISLARNEPDLALCLLNPDIDFHLRDPVVRQRLLNLSVLSRVFVLKGETGRLAQALRALRSGLEVTRTTGRQDYIVASFALGLSAQGNIEEASSYLLDYITHARRDRSRLSTELGQLFKRGGARAQ